MIEAVDGSRGEQLASDHLPFLILKIIASDIELCYAGYAGDGYGLRHIEVSFLAIG